MENKNAIVIFDKFPLSEGHSLLISRRHFKDISLADKKTWSDFLPLLKKTLKELKKIFSPKGFNIISNIGKEAYQSIFHIHIHIIPKYEKEKGFIWN